MKALFFLVLLSIITSDLYGLDLIVTSVTDATDISIGDGICSDISGNCTLRAAIQEINAFGSPTNSITIPSGTYTLSIVGLNEDAAASGDLDCLQSVDIIGENARTTIIDANGIDRVFHLLSGSINLSKLSIINGNIDIGGGIYNASNTSFSEITISNCNSNKGLGGGIYNTNNLTITKSTLHSNTAFGENGQNGVVPGGGGGGGGGAGLGGAIYNTSTLIIQNSTISGNIATGGKGGNGSHHQGVSPYVSPGGKGGGIFGGNPGGINGSGSNGGFGSGGGGGGSITGNGGNGGFGGGAAAGGANSWGGNAGPSGSAGMFGGPCGVMCCSASGGGGGGAGLGGGIFNNGGNITIENVTVTLNEVGGGNGGGGYYYTTGSAGQGVGGGFFNYSGSINFKNSIIANNESSSADPDLYGSYTSNDYNIVQNLGSSTVSGLTTNNITGINPNLSPLSNNGGETDTHAFGCNSIAYNSGDTSILIDQICNSRPQQDQIDRGALELIINIAFKR